MAEGPKQSSTRSKQQAVADAAARRFDEHCPKCGSADVKSVEPFNPVHTNGVYYNHCGRHSFPDEN